MATSEFGMFLPSESAYTKPGGYESSQRGEAMKRGSWLAQLDQFYEELEFKEKELEEMSEYRDAMIELQREQLAQQERFNAGAGGYGGAGYGGGYGGGAGGGYGSLMYGPSGKAMATTTTKVGGYGQPWTSPIPAGDLALWWNMDLARNQGMGGGSGSETYTFPWE